MCWLVALLGRRHVNSLLCAAVQLGVTALAALLSDSEWGALGGGKAREVVAALVIGVIIDHLEANFVLLSDMTGCLGYLTPCVEEFTLLVAVCVQLRADSTDCTVRFLRDLIARDCGTVMFIDYSENTFSSDRFFGGRPCLRSIHGQASLLDKFSPELQELFILLHRLFLHVGLSHCYRLVENTHLGCRLSIVLLRRTCYFLMARWFHDLDSEHGVATLGLIITLTCRVHRWKLFGVMSVVIFFHRANCLHHERGT